jgi:hypothetical protein
VEPLISPEQFEKTRSLVAEALAPGSLLRKLQAELEARNESKRDLSYVSRFWDEMYLGLRSSVAINSNPGAVTRTKGAFDVADQVGRAARIIVANVLFSQKVAAGELKPDEMRGIPLDMRQYTRMFGATRLPQPGKDTLYRAPPAASRHIVVLRGDAFWEVRRASVPLSMMRARAPISPAASFHRLSPASVSRVHS